MYEAGGERRAASGERRAASGGREERYEAGGLRFEGSWVQGLLIMFINSYAQGLKSTVNNKLN